MASIADAVLHMRKSTARYLLLHHDAYFYFAVTVLLFILVGLRFTMLTTNLMYL